jgi:class 3 adenylate cyclase
MGEAAGAVSVEYDRVAGRRGERHGHAAALLRELAGARRAGRAEDRVEIRIAISSGDVVLQDEDVFGTPVNLAARLEEITPAGEAYFTEAVFQSMNRSEIASEVVGRFEFKGIPDPVQVHRIAFRHRSREVRAAPLVTDVVGFSGFFTSAPLVEVEALLQFWEDTHRESASRNRGTLQHILGDGMILTFDTVADAVGALVEVGERIERFNATSERLKLAFAAGVDFGELRMFRAATYGEALNRAAQLSGIRDLANSIVMRESLLAEVGPEHRDQLLVHRIEPAADASNRRKALGPLVALTRSPRAPKSHAIA